MQGFVFGFFPPVPTDAGPPTGNLSVLVPSGQLGVTGTNLPVMFTFLISGHIWSTQTGCTMTITTNIKVSEGIYKVGGNVLCVPVAQVAPAGGPELHVDKFQFTTSVVVSM